LQKIFRFDRKIVTTLISRAVTIFSILGTLFFVSHYLSPTLQGYFYTFYSLLALQALVELGLNTAIIQFASHEMAGLKWSNVGTVIGKPSSKRRLQSLTTFAFFWFVAVAILVILFLTPIGIYFFQITEPKKIQVNLGYTWFLVVFFAAVSLPINAGLAILEGCDKVSEVARIRAEQVFLSSLAIWASLAAGADLYSLAIGGCVILLVGVYSLFTRYRYFFIDLWATHFGLPGIKWKEEIWPFQWRIAVSWGAGFLIFNIFNPLIFATHGPIAAGQMGMSLQVTAALTSIAMIWITTKVPNFGQMISRGDRSGLDHMFKRALLQSIFIVFLGAISLLIIVYWLQVNKSLYGARVMPLIYLAALCVISIANLVFFAQAAYIRAHKIEPLMKVSVLSGIVTAILSIILIPPLSFLGAIIAYGTGSILISLVWTTIIYMKVQKNEFNKAGI